MSPLCVCPLQNSASLSTHLNSTITLSSVIGNYWSHSEEADDYWKTVTDTIRCYTGSDQSSSITYEEESVGSFLGESDETLFAFHFAFRISHMHGGLYLCIYVLIGDKSITSVLISIVGSKVLKVKHPTEALNPAVMERLYTFLGRTLRMVRFLSTNCM
ncbi:hypothetical protein KP509_13G046600 [Ceratopteris richardii]|uniref:Uncharacterized protein n=1 Tax=Ceratopteris richardii TaxID=49495 RepID=A0A8T2THA7_CERRI|nr:hypothetical protein KP509_13G046600 [Ceratopteris richardii]